MIRDTIGEWQELSALYEQADALNGEALDAWLADLANEGHRLLPSLRRMLGAREDARRDAFLSRPPVLVGAAGMRAWAVGNMLGPWRLVRAIGSGGMAEVWLAERADGAFQRTVAVKLLFDHLSGSGGDGFARRFDRERDILATLNHPNIATLHDAGADATGRPWLALEHVDGMPITEWCDSRRLEIRQRIQLFDQVLRAAEHAHSRLILHRDFKPSNVFVDQGGVVKVLDFGIAKLLDADDAGADSDLTLHGGRPLTPSYASPEQLAGAPLSTVSDVYSLGVVLRQLLNGARPQGAAATGAGVRIGDADLDAIVAKMTSHTTSLRYPSVGSARSDLERWLGGFPVSAREPTAIYRLSRFVSRHRVGVASAAAAVTLILSLAAATTLFGIRAQDQADRATLTRDFVVDLFRLADPDLAKEGDIGARGMLESGRRDAMAKLASQPVLMAEVLSRIGVMQMYIGDYPAADSTFEMAARAFRENGMANGFANARTDQADVAFLMGRNDRAAELLKASEAEAAAFAHDDALASKRLLLQGWLAHGAGAPDLARSSMTAAFDRAAKAFGADDARTIAVLLDLATAERSSRDYEQARRRVAEAIERSTRSANIGPRDRIAVQFESLRLEYEAGSFRQALALTPEVLRQCEAALGERTEDCQLLRRIHVVSLLAAGDAAAARANLDRVLASIDMQRSPRRGAESLATVIRMLAAEPGAGQRKDLVETASRLAFDNALDNASRVMVSLALAESSLRDADPGAAELWARQALSLAGEQATTASVARAKQLWALSLQARSRHGEALALFSASTGIYRSIFGERHVAVALARLNEAVSLANSGAVAQAAALASNSAERLASGMGETAPVVARARDLARRLETPNWRDERVDFFFF